MQVRDILCSISCRTPMRVRVCRTSDLDERLLGEHPVENQPDYGQRRQLLNDVIPGTEPLRQAADKNISDQLEVEEMSRYVHRDGIHADHDEEERPFPVPPHIDDKVEECEEHIAQTTGPEHQ